MKATNECAEVSVRRFRRQGRLAEILAHLPVKKPLVITVAALAVPLMRMPHVVIISREWLLAAPADTVLASVRQKLYQEEIDEYVVPAHIMEVIKGWKYSEARKGTGLKNGRMGV